MVKQTNKTSGSDFVLFCAMVSSPGLYLFAILEAIIGLVHLKRKIWRSAGERCRERRELGYCLASKERCSSDLLNLAQ